MHLGSVSNPHACLQTRGETGHVVGEREAWPTWGTYQVPEVLVCVWILTAQNICQHAVYLAHMQSDPVKEVEEEWASCRERLSSHTGPQLHVQQIPLSHSTENVGQTSFVGNGLSLLSEHRCGPE